MIEQMHFHVEVPSIGQSIQYTIPVTLEVNDCIQLMVNLIEKEYPGAHFNTLPILVDIKTETQLDGYLTIEELPLLEGSKLLLI